MTDTVFNKLSSRIKGFYKQTQNKRLNTITQTVHLSDNSETLLRNGGGLDVQIADYMSENVIASHGLPLSIALNFRINDNDHLMPMAIEESSVVAAASNAARLTRSTGGFYGKADDPIMTAQIQFDAVPKPKQTCHIVMENQAAILKEGNAAIPRMVARGGGCVSLEARLIDEQEGIIVIHIYINVGNAMGANLVDTVAEAIAPKLQTLMGGILGLRILTNLTLRRMVSVQTAITTETLGSPEIVTAIERASRFAEKDPMRAVTHNKGIMNGIDAVALALGQDWRAIEAGAHAYAAFSGTYKPLAVWRHKNNELQGTMTLPLAVGTVGGITSVHPGVKAAFELIQISDAQQLAIIMASAGLATNFAALRVLASEGIQRGHMNLHHRHKKIKTSLH